MTASPPSSTPKAVSPVTHPFDPRSWAVSRPDGASWALASACALICASAVYGGIGLLRDSIGMPAEWLEGSPFDSWTLPGVALLLTVALPQGVAAGLAATAHRWGAVAGILAGLGLVAWIAVQVLVFQRYFVLQPVVAAVGFVEVGLAAWWAGRDGTA
jgi:hypothetical protein